MIKVRIVDLDSTVSDDSWRQWMILPEESDSNEKYHAYHIHCSEDELINRWIIDESPVPIIFLTARPEYMREKTEQWLKKNNITPLLILMRANDDHSSSPKMKKRAMEDISRFVSFECAYDDREDVVQMYRNLGVEAVLV